MFKENEYVVYKRDVCKVKGIRHSSRNDQEYYTLAPIIDDSLTISVPTENLNNCIRPLISLEEVERIINEIPNVEAITNQHRMIENEYKRLLNTGDHLDLIKIIKTTYLRNTEREEAGKKTTEKDSIYHKMAEKILYYEFSLVLNMSYDDTEEYVVNKVRELIK